MSETTERFQPLQGDDPFLVGGYRLAARLGAGGMGRVYLSHTQGGRPVALKVVRPELADDPAFLRRFRREVVAARRVRGAYTAELIDADADGVPPWLATLYVPGPSLAEAVGRHGPLPTPALLWLVAGVAEALQAIHDVGIVHRDLKPSNVLLAADGPRVIDFGISLASGTTSPTATGSAVGTPSYMAPEQASVGEITAATDVFALGQTAAFAALGEPLYGEGSAVGVLYRIIHHEPDLSRLPEELRPLLARCLAAEPEERATPAEIVEWCRKRLGSDAEDGAGPTVWQEAMGPEVMIPPPVPEPTPAYTLPFVPPESPQTSRTSPSPQTLQAPQTSQTLQAPPLPQPPQPEEPEARRARRRRTALIVGAIVTAAALLLTGATWTVLDALERFRDGAAASDARDRAPTGGSAASPSASAQGAGDGEDAQGAQDADGSPSGSQPSSLVPPDQQNTLQATPYPLVWLDAKNSVSFEDPVRRENAKGDIRFICEEVGCALESDTSTFAQFLGDTGATLETCRLLLEASTTRHLSLATAAAGSEICVKHRSGSYGLLVIQTKSTALPKLAFLYADLTIWRKP